MSRASRRAARESAIRANNSKLTKNTNNSNQFFNNQRAKRNEETTLKSAKEIHNLVKSIGL